MRISDWSSDVCSSDLPPQPRDQLSLATLHNLDLRRIVPPSVLGDKALEGGSRNGREYAEADDAGRGGAYSVADCEVEVVFNAAGMREEARSGFRQMYPSACTMKERCEIGRAHVCNPVTNAHLVCRLLLEKKKKTPKKNGNRITIK